METNLQLDALLANLVSVRKHIKALKEIKAKAYQEYLEYIKPTTDAILSAVNDEQFLEEEIRKIALSIYEVNKEKNVYPNIKEVDRVRYEYEASDAYEWCSKHDMFLELDKNAFDKFLRQNKGYLLAFVTRVVEPSITIAQEIKVNG